MDDLVGDRVYVDDAQWRLFEDLDQTGPRSRNILLVLGSNWTILSAEVFRALAARILEQLP